MYRYILISKPAKIYQKHHQLVVENEAIHHLPIEDIAVVVIDGHQTSITTNCLDMLVRQGTCVIVCDEKHMPSGVLQPVAAYSRRLPVLKLQMEQSKPRLKRLWQQIVKQKIANQGRCLQLAGYEDDVSTLADRVKSGDVDNVEAVAAARYFKVLFGSDFSRSDEVPANALLNYGYAIVRAYVSRQLATYGLEPSVGIFHHSELNLFNLADDVIEPFRPMVDLWVLAMLKAGEQELTPNAKSQLIAVLSHDVLLGGEYHPISYAVERMVQGLVRCYKGESDTLVLPELVPIKVHEYE